MGSVSKDYKEAAKWFQLAAEQGDTDAQVNLALMFSGGFGVVQDYVQAHMWCNIAGASGSEKGRDCRNTMAGYMTPTDISKAQEMARHWMGSQ
jgi:hypothetical protein